MSLLDKDLAPVGTPDIRVGLINEFMQSFEEFCKSRDPHMAELAIMGVTILQAMVTHGTQTRTPFPATLTMTDANGWAVSYNVRKPGEAASTIKQPFNLLTPT